MHNIFRLFYITCFDCRISYLKKIITSFIFYVHVPLIFNHLPSQRSKSRLKNPSDTLKTGTERRPCNRAELWKSDSHSRRLPASERRHSDNRQHPGYGTIWYHRSADRFFRPHIPISNCRLKKPKPLTSAPGSKTTNAILFSPAKNIWMRPARVFPSTMTVWQQLFPGIIYWVKRSRSPSPNWETKICFFWANSLCIMIRSRKSAGRRVLNQWLSTQAHTWIIFLTLWAKNTGFPCWCACSRISPSFRRSDHPSERGFCQYHHPRLQRLPPAFSCGKLFWDLCQK